LMSSFSTFPSSAMSAQVPPRRTQC
jgi:hypothetical protein